MVVGRSSSMLSALFCLWIVVPSATCLSFNLSFLDPASRSGIELQGNATWNTTDGIQLTNDSIIYNVGRAVYREPLLLWDARTKALSDFTTHFSFIIRNSSKTSSSGDGLAFFMAPYPSPLVPDSSDGSFGIFPRVSLNYLVPTVAVEFDTYQNQWDVDDHHVGIDVNSIVSQKVASWNGSLKTGRLANAWVSYDAITLNLSVFLTYADNPVISGDSVLHFIIDPRDHLPANVTVGFSAATGQVTETHAVLSWSFSSSLQPRSIPPPTTPTASDAAKSKSKTGLIVGLVIGAGALMVMPSLLLFVLWRRRRKSRHRNAADREEDMDFDQTTDDDFMGNRGPKRFAYKELARATRNFSAEGKLGEGGFGSVYRGHLKDLKLDVAIKRVSRESRQGRKEYVSEVKIISRLRHRNLVQLVGWCHDRGEFLLVYEFMPNGSLDSYLYRPATGLGWPARHKIALGLASALLYLHEEWEQCVMHRDVKPSNIMLDSAFNAKLGDFGLARLVDHDRNLHTTDLAGTRVYIAPECFYTGKPRKESDVYSFGIVALEIACGRRPVELKEKDPGEEILVEWVWELYGRRTILEAADARLDGDFDETQMECLMVVGLWCAHPDYNLRPSIRQAINALNLETPLPELSPKMPVPMYYTPWSDVSQSLHVSSLATTTSITAKSAPTGSSSMSPSSCHLLKSPYTEAVIST
ncbi:L-type lectin-domain containing receptor kinase IX.1-like [Musa acuminata AAA Group]|uniref:L-type lectin-domain containing receptor kinase IX.1-like n=1 Tax=Musa acuminata AAA Group TaxID=214697 RepID=UPI0031D66188